MENKAQKNSIILAILGFTGVVVIAGLIGYLTIGKSDDVIQGEIEVSEYRVSSKVPGRILELRVKEGDTYTWATPLPFLTLRKWRQRRRRRRAQKRQPRQ